MTTKVPSPAADLAGNHLARSPDGSRESRTAYTSRHTRELEPRHRGEPAGHIDVGYTAA